MALLSDREGFDKAAMEAVEKQALVDVMNSAIYHETRGFTELTESNIDRLMLARDHAKRMHRLADTPFTRSRSAQLVAIVENRIRALAQ